MCGIVGYVGKQQAAPVIMDGLGRLEYRGYDSAGVAVYHDHAIHIRRNAGKLGNLRAKIAQEPLCGTIGIGHTRWATHGAPVEHNAHPHISMDGAFVVVHNGILENYLELRTELQAQGVVFTSETDTEVIVQLIARLAQSGVTDLTDMMRQLMPTLRGSHAIGLFYKNQPDRLVACRIGNAGGVVIGLGSGENFVASDVSALLEHTRTVLFLESRQIATLTADGYQVINSDATPVTPVIHTIPFDQTSIVKGAYQHFMQKEIHEQAQSITDTIRGRVQFKASEVVLPELNLTAETARALRHVVTVACGTSYYSGLVGKFYIEQLARLRVECDYGSEYRYRQPILDSETAVLAITQSGETVDTLAAVEEARNHNATIWAIVNTLGSQAMRLSNGHISMHAGTEIGVASTKAFTTSIVDQYLLALYLGQLRGTLTREDQITHVQNIARLPDLVGRALETDQAIRALAQKFHTASNFLYLGRGINYPIALEGALKLKEISYIHAEGYPAGEMKHGPIALIDAHMPVVCIAPKDALYDKMISQIEQVKARGGIVIAIATEGDTLIPTKADHVVYMPVCPPMLNPIVNVVPLQLLAYHIAVLRGADVDQPRNLAKSVTVE